MYYAGNYYTDTCLIAAGGKPQGTLDFYQIHSYANNGVWDYNGPFKVDNWYPFNYHNYSI